MMQVKGVSFRHAVEPLREGALDVPMLSRGRIRVPPPVRFDADDQALLAETIRYYHERMLRLPEKTRKAGSEIRSRLQKVELWRESGHEHFNGSIVIPAIALTGTITEVYGREINDNLREGTPKDLYLPGTGTSRRPTASRDLPPII